MTPVDAEAHARKAATPEVLVSVIIPAYNPGPYLVHGLLRSLRGQTLSEEQFEIIVVDDGSTDDTLEELERAARRIPNLQYVSIANSGWPGRPRNVGTQLATGRYVFYSDHDDAFFPDALRRMVELADATAADIVYGKVVRSGSPTPYWSLWGGDTTQRDQAPAHLLNSRTVHKLFRREFLMEHRLTFPEGPVRLEDHLFMGKAVPLAQNIAVLSSYPCYRWVHRFDGS
ncbi:MAG: glycosyltransferase family 2 protein, partial [Angustibacter sp.]